MKKAGLILLILLVFAAGTIWFFRYDIFQFSAETIIKKKLPPFVTVDRIIFDLENGKLEVKGFGLKNPRGYSGRYLASMELLTCRYKMTGKTLLDGIEITDITAVQPAINIERLRNGRINVADFGEMMKKDMPSTVAGTGKKTARTGPAERQKTSKPLSEMIKLPRDIGLQDGRISFLDKAVGTAPYTISFDNANGVLSLVLDHSYSEVLSVSSNGTGLINGAREQQVSWIISMDPRTVQPTMSNRIEMSNVNILLFKPYYAKYSPVDITGGRFSGTLIFDLDNGNIGSSNTITLTGLSFTEKQQTEASRFWDVSISDIIKYLESSPGQIVFDFKIKGNIQDPMFYPGPHVKQALQNLAVDKISGVIQDLSKGDDGGGGQGSDAEKVLNMMKGLLNQ